MLTSIEQFVEFAANSTVDEIYDAFEFNCSEELRDEVYALSTPDANEPARDAFIKLGKLHNVQSLINF